MTINRIGNADIQAIQAFEKKYNLQLPKDYVDFLLQFNGGDVVLDDNNEVFVRYLNDRIHIDVFFGINTGEPQLDLDWRMEKYKDDISSDTVIIGDSYEHGFIVLLCSGEDAGVYYWDHTYTFECSNDESNTYFIADTFTDLINGLL